MLLVFLRTVDSTVKIYGFSPGAASRVSCRVLREIEWKLVGSRAVGGSEEVTELSRKNPLSLSLRMGVNKLRQFIIDNLIHDITCLFQQRPLLILAGNINRFLRKMELEIVGSRREEV